MKQMIAIALMLMLLVTFSASAECGCGECADCLCKGQAAFPMAKSPECYQSGIYIGVSWWALAENQLVIGKKAPDENVGILPAQMPVKGYLRGCGDNGLIREKGAMRVLTGEDGNVYGLKQLNVSIQIRQECLPLVEEIMRQRLDEYAGINAANLIACTQWWAGETVCHIFFTSASAKIAVGTVTVNGGKDVVTLYAGDFNGDGSLELGFAAGWTVPEPPKQPETPSTPCGRKPCDKKPCGNGCGGCGIHIQINILSLVKNIVAKCQ